VGRLFKALREGRPSDVGELAADEFRYQRAAGPPQDLDMFLARWPDEPWTVSSLRAAGTETILEAVSGATGLVWLCRVAGGKVERIVEYRDAGR
jgi:ketosteroid isomerase-like protein